MSQGARPFRLALLACAVWAGLAGPAPAERALIAVAANFLETAEGLAEAFSRETAHEIRLASGSTGKLYAQIVAGAPYHAFLAADAARPARLVAEGLAEPGSLMTYATGELVLWSATPGLIGEDGQAALADPRLRSVAIANPALAPYGLAAREALEALGLWESLEARIVMGQNVGQTVALIATGNAPLGFIPRAAALSPRLAGQGSLWPVPGDLHAPVRQDAVLLNSGKDNAAARAFLAFLASPEAGARIREAGYGVE